MCGFVAFCGFRGGSVEASALTRALEALSHRGPDASGLIGWAGDGQFKADDELDHLRLEIGLGHRRLAIFDLSDAGRQPMTDRNGRWIVYNGEIYNFPELRDELKQSGYDFQTATDTEVILAAYDRWGEDCVRRFNGMWAFIIYDPGRRVFFCSRDRFGIKPFYYAVTGGGVYFASEITALFLISGIAPRFNRKYLGRYLAVKSEEGPATLFSQVEELSPAHSMTVNFLKKDIQIWRWWLLPEEPDLEINDREALDQFSALFEESVRLRLRADVPVAVTLSGGIDSSSVLAAASRVSNSKIRVFTSRFPRFPEIDESGFAEQAARACGAEQVFVEPDLDALLNEEPLMTLRQGLPYGGLSLFVHWAIIKKIKEHQVPVVLSGQGGDELFMGYERYYVSYILSRLPNLKAVISAAGQGVPRSRLSLSVLIMYLVYFGVPGLRERRLLRLARKIYHPALVAARFKPEPMVFRNRRELQASEICGRQLQHLLRYDDRNTSAHGMETRLPFLDYRLVEWAYRLPWKFKIRDGWTKYLLRLYLERHVPGSVAWRTNKLGFNAPEKSWVQSLISHHGQELMRLPLSNSILKPGVTFLEMSLTQQWDVYNILRLAELVGIGGEAV